MVALIFTANLDLICNRLKLNDWKLSDKAKMGVILLGSLLFLSSAFLGSIGYRLPAYLVTAVACFAVAELLWMGTSLAYLSWKGIYRYNQK